MQLMFHQKNEEDMHFASIVANIAAGETIKKLGSQSIDGKELTNKVYETIEEKNAILLSNRALVHSHL